MEPDAVFDGSGQVQRPPYGSLAKEAWSLLFYRPAPPSVEGLPQGEGRPVLFLPAALTNDSATRPLRRPLARCGFRALWRCYDPAVDLARLARPLPLPAMAICTRHDGIVAWRNCVSDDPSCQTVELTGAHLTLCRDPRALRAIAARLAED